MKKAFLIVGAFVGIVTAVALYWANQHATIIYPATHGHADWMTYSSNENGFQIRHPAGWSMSQHGESLDLSGPNMVQFSVRRIPLSLNVLKQEAQRGRYLPKQATRRQVVIAGLSGEQFNYWIGNFEGTWRMESFAIPRDSCTYLISWSAGDSARKDTPADQTLCRAVAASFRLVELRHADHLNYTDPAHRFSFEFPSGWQLVGGANTFPAASVRDKTDTWIAVYVWPKLSINDFQRQHGITALTEKSEWFAHRLPGQRGRWNDSEAYMFEKGGDLVVINIHRAKQPAEVMTRFFDSFALGP